MASGMSPSSQTFPRPHCHHVVSLLHHLPTQIGLFIPIPACFSEQASAQMVKSFPPFPDLQIYIPKKVSQKVPIFGTGSWEVQRGGGIYLRDGSVSFDLLDLHSALYKVYLA